PRLRGDDVLVVCGDDVVVIHGCAVWCFAGVTCGRVAGTRQVGLREGRVPTRPWVLQASELVERELDLPGMCPYQNATFPGRDHPAMRATRGATLSGIAACQALALPHQIPDKKRA
ncbi:hypothetical protein CNQ84_19135, partial [Pseudomonas abyssi]